MAPSQRRTVVRLDGLPCRAEVGTASMLVRQLKRRAEMHVATVWLGQHETKVKMGKDATLVG